MSVARGPTIPPVLMAAPGPTPWYPLLQGPAFSSRAGPMSWQSAGDTEPAAGKVVLVGADGRPRLALDFYSHVLPLSGDRLLVWYVRELARLGGRLVRSEFVLRVFKVDDLAPIMDRDAAYARLSPTERMHAEASPTAEVTIATDLHEGTHPYSFPEALGDVSDLPCFVHSTDASLVGGDASGMSLVLWELHPRDGTLEVTPQDWFNRGNFDFGYQWPTRVARDPASGSLLGEGIRLGIFELDDTKRHVKRWLHEDPFWMPQRAGPTPTSGRSVHVDWRALGYAVAIETVLATAAVFGGPHGALGAIPWMLNLPGVFVVFGSDSERYFLARVVLAVTIQVAVWYGVFALWRRRRRRQA